MNLESIIKRLPHEPGVYRFLNSEGMIIYIGKAKDLKKRVSQYFHSTGSMNRKTAVMVGKIASIVHTVVESEEDALLLENNLIKEFQPRYNMMLKDSKSYPWIMIKNEPFPRVYLTRKFVKDGSMYFGPYASATHAYNLLNLIQSLYRLRSCKQKLNVESIEAHKFKPCLNSHIGKCLAPCAGYFSKRDYDNQIDAIERILKGKSVELIREFRDKMKSAADKLEFEQAHEYKTKMELLENHYSKSLVVSQSITDIDVFTLLIENSDLFGNFMRVRSGAIIQSFNLAYKMRIEEQQSSLMSRFISDISERFGELSNEILVSFMPDYDFGERRIHIPLRGEKLALLELSRKNASAFKFDNLKHEEIVNPDEHRERILENLRRDLLMEQRPGHIECFDNSNIQGTNPVSSCVVFKNGESSKKDYRHFNIKTVVGANDFASMKEVVNRRYSRMLREGEALPQLIVIDGGRGQLNFAYEALLELGIESQIRIVGIAKRLEEIIIPGDPYPLFLDKNSTSLKLLMQIRDEAHRFGITHHRSRRSKGQIDSALRDIPFIGEKGEQKLLQKYKSVSRIKNVPYNELAALIGSRAASSLLIYFGVSEPEN